MPPLIQNTLFAAIIAALSLLIAALLNRGVQRVAQHPRFPPGLIKPLQSLSRWSVLVVAFLLILSTYDVGIHWIWSVISTILALIAIGFVAVWSLLSNVSASLLLVFTRPFQLGDTIEFVGEGTKGKVVRLGIMLTSLQNEAGEVFQIPNNMLFQKVVKRQPREQARTAN